MSKRFTDTTKWSNPWYRKMPSGYRDLWDYILDHCDHAGIWRADVELASLTIGEALDYEIALAHFGDRVLVIKNDKWFIPGFIKFQYGELKESCKPHQSVIKLLILEQIDPSTLSHLKGLAKGKQRVLYTHKDKDKDKDKEKEKDFEKLYQKYPLKRGKALGLVRLKKIISTDEDFNSFSKAIDLYTADLEKSGTKPEHIKHFSTFVGSGDCQPWRDWLDADAGESRTSGGRSTPTIVSDLPREYP